MESKKAMSRCGNYQDSVTAPLDHASDDGAVAQNDEEEHSSTSDILSVVQKVGSPISPSL